MKEISVTELKSKIDSNELFQLIDVREPHEHEAAQMGGLLIPMGEIVANKDKIATDKPVIIHCRSGARSAAVVKLLEDNFGFTNLYNLKGGIMAWAAEIDSSIKM